MSFEMPWTWKRSPYGFTIRTDPEGKLFHAYDINCNCACQPSNALIESVEEPNEGSPFCGLCIILVQVLPEGREKKVFI